MSDGYEAARDRLLKQPGVEEGTMMKTPCLRYRGDFLGMIFEREDALIVKLPAERVLELVNTGQGNPFEFTGKRFREWLLVPREMSESYAPLLEEALAHARARQG